MAVQIRVYAGHTKKVCMKAILLMGFSLGNILGPLSFGDHRCGSLLCQYGEYRAVGVVLSEERPKEE